MITNVDEFFSLRKGKLTYPSLYLEKVSDDIVPIFEGLPKGELPLLVEYNGKLVEVIKIEKSPLTIKTLLTFTPAIMLTGPDTRVRFENVHEMLEADIDWTV